MPEFHCVFDQLQPAAMTASSADLATSSRLLLGGEVVNLTCSHRLIPLNRGIQCQPMSEFSDNTPSRSSAELMLRVMLKYSARNSATARARARGVIRLVPQTGLNRSCL